MAATNGGKRPPARRGWTGSRMYHGDAAPRASSPSRGAARALVAAFSQELLCSCRAGSAVGGGKQHQQGLELGWVTQTAAGVCAEGGADSFTIRRREGLNTAERWSGGMVEVQNPGAILRTRNDSPSLFTCSLMCLCYR